MIKLPVKKILLGLLLVMSFSVLEGSDIPTKKKQPNIVFFFVGDMGWQDTSVPFYKEVTALNQRYQTPNMERLAREGMKFTQAYASAVCTPSRVSLMTGVNAARHKVTNWTLIKDESPDSDHKVIKSPDWNLNGLSPVPNIPHTFFHSENLPLLLSQNDYRTIHVGKAHFGALGTPGEDPLNLGFNLNIGGNAAGGPGSYLGIHNFSGAWKGSGNPLLDLPGLEAYHGEAIYLTEALTREGLKAISKAVEDDKPFYLYLSHYANHPPREKDERFYQNYINQGLNELDATYASMIEGMDKSLGDIMNHLDKLGVDDNTIVVFMSDNGPHPQVPQNLPLRGHKLGPYEGGIRVPLLVKWPGVTLPGKVSEDCIIIEDIFPTFLEMAGLNSLINKSIDGQSFVPLLKGEPSKSADRTLLWHFPNTYFSPPYSVVRKGDWKLIYYHVDQKFELFNLEDDISESTELSSSNRDKTKEMAVLMTELLKETKAQMPTLIATGQLVPYPDQVYSLR
ncbi:sulfatase [uncultured Cyclobacterium sp.]|uniref:sulfatase n=1 Tax=uncultured Cyclobacterium sp. TaxID=453820 RepID=UPI0030EE1386|tara:strand:+ start:1974 stop:3497 length:1524 start_codon:yes stop_codon:yes gene_type:complete